MCCEKVPFRTLGKGCYEPVCCEKANFGNELWEGVMSRCVVRRSVVESNLSEGTLGKGFL